MGLTYTTAGESHGPALFAVIEGLPAGLPLDVAQIDRELRRRQGGYGRGARMRMEQDAVAVRAGVLRGVTIGSPIVLEITNRDSRLDTAPPLHCPRPGHADLAGCLKWLIDDARGSVERASARETAARVAAGACARALLDAFGIRSVGFVREIGGAASPAPNALCPDQIIQQRDSNEVYAVDPAAANAMIEVIRAAKQAKDTVGGVVEVRVFGLPPGLGSCMSWSGKLDGRLMQAVGSIQAIKGVEIGLGFEAARRRGSQVHDPIEYLADRAGEPAMGFVRRTNHAGGLEGGMTNGAVLVVRAAMKPISTLLQGMDSVNLRTLQPERSDYERSDVCAVPAASVVAENVVAFEIARAFLEKFAGDTLAEVRHAYDGFYRLAREALGRQGAAQGD